MFEVIPNEKIGMEGVKALRQLSPLSISGIKGAATAQTSVRSIEAFGTGWQSERKVLAAIARLYLGLGMSVFRVQIREESGGTRVLSPDSLIGEIKRLREIELETQRNIDLEEGYISTPEEFEPHDEDWA